MHRGLGTLPHLGVDYEPVSVKVMMMMMMMMALLLAVRLLVKTQENWKYLSLVKRG